MEADGMPGSNVTPFPLFTFPLASFFHYSISTLLFPSPFKERRGGEEVGSRGRGEERKEAGKGGGGEWTWMSEEVEKEGTTPGSV